MNKEKYRYLYEKYILPKPNVYKVFMRFFKYKKLKNSIKKTVKGKNNKFLFNSSILINLVIDIKGENNSITIENGSILTNVKFYLRGNNHTIHIGKNCQFVSGGLIWFENHHGVLKIGDNTTIEDVHFAITEQYSKIIIGKDCMFAYNIDIRTGDSHCIMDMDNGKQINFAKDVYIEDHVWLASHCKILKGVQIKRNSVVGTSAVVTKAFESENLIIAGNPAKVVKTNINWSRERFCDESNKKVYIYD